MGLFNKIDKEKTASIKVKSPREIYSSMLKQMSGSGQARANKFDIFYQIVAFKGVMEGVGCSTLVANVAVAVAQLGVAVCVVDTSVKHPVQDILLKTDYKSVPKEKRLDWFNMPFTRLSVLHESKIHHGISVLSFYGQERGILDILSTNDSPYLVDLAFTELHNKFDLILVDCCDETTSINTAALQQSQHVIQVWNDMSTILHNVDGFLNDCATLSCPLDKMRNVVYSKIMDDVSGDIDGLLTQYHCRKIGENSFSKDVARVFAIDKLPYQYPTTNEDIIEYTNCIIDIACHVLNIHREDAPKGTITSQDIVDGKVEGTVHKKYKDTNEEVSKTEGNVAVARTLEEADAQLTGKTINESNVSSSNDTTKGKTKGNSEGELRNFDDSMPVDDYDEFSDDDFAPDEDFGSSTEIASGKAGSTSKNGILNRNKKGGK